MKTIDVGYDTEFASNEEQDLCYCGSDAIITWELYPVLLEQAKKEGVLHTYEFRRELLGPYYYGCSRRGMAIDLNLRETMASELRAELDQYAKKFAWATKTVFDMEVNWKSAPQLKKFFYDLLMLPPSLKYDKKKAKSTVTCGDKAMKRIIRNSPNFAPWAKAIQDLRGLKKRLEMYEKELLNNRFMYQMNPVGTYTGRAASKEHSLGYGSNGQNVAPGERRMFKPDRGKVLVYADGKSAESYVVGYKSGDEKYIEACESGDVHTYVASQVYGIPNDKKVASEFIPSGLKESARQMGKKVGHASNYHGKPAVIAEQTGVTRDIISDFQDVYFAAFPGIAEWHDWCYTKAQLEEPFYTPFNYKVTFHGFKDPDLEKVIAFCPQSTVAQIMHTAALSIWNELDDDENIQLLSNQHDALILQLTRGMEDDILPLIAKHMVMDLPVEDIHGKVRTMRIPCDFKVGLNWQEYHPEKFPKGQLYEYEHWKEIRSSL